jgi:hypothetical protein
MLKDALLDMTNRDDIVLDPFLVSVRRSSLPGRILSSSRKTCQGELRPAQKTVSGSIIVPHVILGDVAEAFIATAYDRGWILPGFDWVSWVRSEDAQALCSDPSALAQAEPMQLLYLITALIRQDRFSEGTLLNAFRAGLILGIVRRAAAIVEDEKRKSQS